MEIHDIPKDAADWIDNNVAWCSRSHGETLHTTFGMVSEVLGKNIPGCFVECGTFAGSHPAVMAYACTRAGMRRKIHLFDSWEGIPHAGPRDVDNINGVLFNSPKDGVLKSSGIDVISMGQVMEYMVGWGVDQSLMVFHKGWFQDTVPKVDIGVIAILRLDGDLYESNKVCMEHLYDKVVPGGFIVIDDWAMRGAREAIRDVLGYWPEVTEVKDGGGPVWWRKEKVT